MQQPLMTFRPHARARVILRLVDIGGENVKLAPDGRGSRRGQLRLCFIIPVSFSRGEIGLKETRAHAPIWEPRVEFKQH